MNEFFRIQEFIDTPKRVVYNIVPQASIGLRRRTDIRNGALST